MSPSLRIDRPGVRTLIQDLGRPGHARLGVTASGAWDRAALTLANRLLGNAEGAAGLEVLLGGLSLTALQPIMVALTGAEAPLLVDGRPAQYAPVALPRAPPRPRDADARPPLLPGRARRPRRTPRPRQPQFRPDDRAGTGAAGVRR